MAQLAEHRIRNAEVAGSIPVLGNFCKKMPKSEPRVWLVYGIEVKRDAAREPAQIPVLGNFCKKMPKNEPRVWRVYGWFLRSFITD